MRARKAKRVRKRAPKRNTSKFVPAHRRYTPELIASGRVRYEQTAESVAAIAADFDVLPGSFRRMVRRFKWVRPGVGPRELPQAARLHTEATLLESTLGLSAGTATQAEAAEPVSHLATIARLEQAVLKELSTVEAMRAQLGALPRRACDAERTARTLSTLTETLNKLQRMRCLTGGKGESAEDNLTVAEETLRFRAELWRRIQGLKTECCEEDAARTPMANPFGEPLRRMD